MENNVNLVERFLQVKELFFLLLQLASQILITKIFNNSLLIFP